tara:strand:+ start:15878 stop:16063 length:186 start_codon:yes stop_codon:yes gene_type:complete
MNIADISEFVDIEYPDVCDECGKTCEGNVAEVDGIGKYCAYENDGELYGCYYEVKEEIANE